MKRVVKYIVVAFIAVATLALNSCNKIERPDPLEIVSLDKIGGSLSDGLKVTMTIANNTGYNVRVTAASVFMRYNNKKIGHLTVGEVIELPRRSSTQVTVPVSVAFSSTLTAMGAVSKVMKGEYKGFSVDYSVTVATRLIKSYTVKGESTPLEELVKEFYK